MLITSEPGDRRGSPLDGTARVEPRRSRTLATLAALDRGEQLRFPLAALLLISITVAFGLVGHRRLPTDPVETGVSIAVLGTTAAVISIVVGCVSLMRWRLVGDRSARDLGWVFVLLGPAWLVPLCVLPTLVPDAELTGTVSIGAGLVTFAGAMAMRSLLPPVAGRTFAILSVLTALVLGAAAVWAVHDVGVATDGGLATLGASPSALVAVVAGSVPLLAVRRGAWMMAWAGLAALGIVAGELFTDRSLGPDDSWALARPILSAAAVSLALIGAGMGLRDAYLDVRTERDRVRRELRATGERYVAELDRRRRTRHDARSSLMAIHGAIELIEGELHRHRADTSVLAATKLEVDRLRALVDAGAPEPPRAVRVLDLVDPAIQLHCRSRLRRVDVEPDLMLMAAPTTVALVLQNLLDNASRHAGGRAVEIEATGRGEFVEVAVMDRGPGVPPLRVPHIFEWGYTSDPHGEGLGLHIARALALDQGGELHYEPRPGGGARFVLTLPAATSPAALAAI